VDGLAHPVIFVFYALGFISLHHYCVARLGTSRMDGRHAGFTFEEAGRLSLADRNWARGCACLVRLLHYGRCAGSAGGTAAGCPRRTFASATRYAWSQTRRVADDRHRAGVDSGGGSDYPARRHWPHEHDQVWMLFAVSAAAAFGWLLEEFPFWKLRWRTIYQTGLYLLLAGAFMFTVTATTDKVSDRITAVTPRTLDGMTFMNYAQHFDGNMMDLSQDYRAIRWMQDNVQGSPVIVEANCTEYRWCTRFTIYTGLPGVVGWNWHQRQQRGASAPNAINDRVSAIGTFYTTPDIDWALAFLGKYHVKYIVVGQLERNIYPDLGLGADGLAKFEEYEGKYWKAVYHNADTTIYEVMP
jgi:hypothetical protein